jgi:Porphyromonas-type peptidyl-arginine deiminase
METHPLILPALKRISILMTLCLPLWEAEEISSTPRFIGVKTSPDFSQPCAPDALTFACFNTGEEAEAYFASRGLPFERALLREIEGNKCHLFYLPTIEGFRADPDNKPITELFFDVQSLRFASKADRLLGDPLDIAKYMLAQINRPLQVRIGVNKLHDEKFYQAAREFHFKDSPHHLALRNSHTDADNWPQDYLKSGTCKGERKILLPYRLYEGKPDYGELYKSLLDGFNEQPFVRSKLSWEGGDLQFVLDPKNSQKTILFYGHGGRTYWGRALTPDEYAYVLKLEFGADYLVDLSDLASHVDYFLAFIPKENIALVSEPLRKNYSVACTAAERLLEMIGMKKPVPTELVSLKTLLSGHDHKELGSSPGLRRQLDRTLEEVKQNERAWVTYEDRQLQQRLARYLQFKCGEDSRCVEKLYSPPQGQGEILMDDIDLLRDCNDAYLISKSNESLFKTYVAIIKSQFSETSPELQKKINDKIQEIRQLGFRVIRVPQIGADGELPWSGISYANNLLVDNLLFLPKFGLGAVEDEIIDGIEKELPKSYRVIPVFSQNSIVYNGGIHCRTGIVR